ncbi:MAG: putative Ig domain-containing protein [Pyrinomonadaceae bacterium]
MSNGQSTLTFITESLPTFFGGQTTEFDIEVSGGTQPYTFQITQGTLPAGLTFSSQGKISGAPTSAGNPTTIFVKVTDDQGSELTQAFDVQVSGDEEGVEDTSTLTFVTESLPPFFVGETAQVDIQVVGGTPPYTFEITEGTLPNGLNFSNQGRISGTPTDSNDSTTVSVKATDNQGDYLTQAFDVQVETAQGRSADQSSRTTTAG